jgi:hypothetical protein
VEAPAPAPTPSEAAVDESDIPTEQDFEDEAARELTATNLDAQLDALEKEILAE